MANAISQPNTSPIVRSLGLQDYQTVWQQMLDFTLSRNSNSADEFWLVQHPPVFTLGQAGKPIHILAAGDIPVVQCDRGGQVTYHGPGQLVLYVLVDIARLGIGSRALVTAIEQTMVSTLATLGINANADPSAPGVYVDGAKIGSLGLRIKEGRSYHGLSLNVAMDLQPFQRINPCGYAGMQMTQVSTLVEQYELEAIEGELIKGLADNLALGQPSWQTAQPT